MARLRPLTAAVPSQRRVRPRSGGRSGQSAIEFVIAYSALILPLTFALIFTAQLLWIWHTVVDFTRQGARYASTHCYQSGAANVINYMRGNTPLMPDREQFMSGDAQIVVDYFGRDEESGQLTEFTCEGADCSRECVPHVVRVGIANYQYRPFFGYLGLPPVPIPNFETMLPIESAGCSPDDPACVE